MDATDYQHVPLPVARVPRAADLTFACRCLGSSCRMSNPKPQGDHILPGGLRSDIREEVAGKGGECQNWDTSKAVGGGSIGGGSAAIPVATRGFSMPETALPATT